MAQKAENSKPFLTDVKTLRERARKNLSDGAVTSTYGGDVAKTIELLQTVLATELVCVLRYSMHAVAAEGISSEGVRAEFAQHAKEEREHAHKVAERINQLGGKPNYDPEGLASRSASEYGSAETLVEMIEENLIAERIAVEHYQELIRYFGDADPGTRLLLEEILVVEEEHASDMHDLLIDRKGEAQHPNRTRTGSAINADAHREALLDEAGKESFPASDSPSVGNSH
jgi:bacterioferritin